MLTAIIIQARTGSTRFKNKILQKINKKTILEILLDRLIDSNFKVIIATTKKKEDNKIVEIANKYKVNFFRGDEKNVLKRYYYTAQKFGIQNIIRITSDCPFIDQHLIKKMFNEYKKKNADYLSNTIKRTFPDGLDCEIFRFAALKNAFKYSKTKSDLEHVTPFIIRNKKLKKINFKYKCDFSELRITLDYIEDFLLLKQIFKINHFDFKMKWENCISTLLKQPSLQKINLFRKNKVLSKDYQLWNDALKLIPGGNMFLSKRPTQFLPNIWPVYFKKAKGCTIIDINNRKYYDFALMGVGTNVLGYKNDKIDREVIKNIKKSNMCSLNNIKDIELGKKLISIHPWAAMSRFTRSGGESNAVAIRIAKASTNRKAVLASGYHGWHDWYMSSKISNKSRFKNFLPDYIQAEGVNKEIAKDIFLFEPYNFKDFKNVFLRNKKKIGIVKMEVARNEYPKKSFLKKVRDFCDKYNLILIFDECTSGFRETYGGIHLKYNVFPDIAIFGKAIGNGYAINAVIGKRNIMENANKTFISSTFWTEGIGTTAALATINEMKKIQSYKYVKKTGIKIKEKWKRIFKKYNFNVRIAGIDSLPNFIFKDNNKLYKSFLVFEMLKYGFITSNSIYICFEHKDHLIKKYLYYFEKSLKKLRDLIESKNINYYEAILDLPNEQISRDK